MLGVLLKLASTKMIFGVTIPMNATRILLAQPLFFDRKVQGDNEANTHAFLWNGCRIHLYALRLTSIASPQSSTTTPHARIKHNCEEESKEQGVKFAFSLIKWQNLPSSAP